MYFLSTLINASAAVSASRHANWKTKSPLTLMSPGPGLSGMSLPEMEKYSPIRRKRRATDLPPAGSIWDSGKFKDIPPEKIDKAFFVPKLCNQCAKPSCVQVCPVGATYQNADGVVLVDQKWCIGCGYCIMACPYGMRFFHPVLHVADKCNFCYHRINRNMQPACVQACPTGGKTDRQHQRPPRSCGETSSGRSG